MKTDFLFGTTKRGNRASQRLRSHQDETRRGQHLARGGAIVRLVEVNQHVRAMERNHRRRSPVQDERQEMDRDVPEINVEQLRLIFLEQMLDLQDLAVAKSARALFASSETRTAARNASPVFRRQRPVQTETAPPPRAFAR